MAVPELRYARTRHGGHVAYQVWGEGPVDLLQLTDGTNISIDDAADEPHVLGYERRLASFTRLIRFDMPGVGFSDPIPPGVELGLDRWVEVALDVLDAAGSDKAALVGTMVGSMVAMLCAATHPERVRALIIVNGWAKMFWAEDYPIGFPLDPMSVGMGDEPGDFDDAPWLVPRLASEPGFKAWWSRSSRRGAGPNLARDIKLMFRQADVRSVLPVISVPTLIIQRKVLAAHGEYLAERIPLARYVGLRGADILPYSGNAEEIVGEMEEFLTGQRQGAHTDRVLATIMLSDIVQSTAMASDLGDRRWRELLDDHEDMSRRLVEQWGGTFVKSTGDGTLARFDGPARAIECARAIRARARQLGLSVRIGLHTGEIEQRAGADIGGIAVHIAARVAAAAGSGDILSSSTVKDLVIGSGIAFEERGEHELRGVPGTWRLFAVVD